jgi:xanthine dehydrogenase accessory factor
MMLTSARRIAARVAELVDQRRPFVLATVVRAQCPTSTRPGDAAVVLPDGSIEGFVGGQCAEGSVRAAALSVLEDGEAALLRILPDDAATFPDTPGAITTVNPCLSGGALEIYLEPKLPAPVLMIVGQTPIAAAVADLGQSLGFAVQAEPGAGGPPTSPEGATAVIVASHGRYEPEAIRAALDAGVGFVGLVASSVRGTAVVVELGLDDQERKRVHTPVGIEIGARTAEEIALSILAEVVRAIRVDGLRAPRSSSRQSVPATAVDPVCGMTVTVTTDTPHLRHDGVDHWFCNPGCRTRYAEQVGAAR